jgi:hypothetical protein
MAEIRALMRELVLEKRLAGEVLEIRIMNPAIAHGLVGQAVDVLEQEQPDDEPGLDPRPPLVAIERRDLAIDPVPVDLAGELNQLVLHADDLVEPGTKQIAFLCHLRLPGSHRLLRYDHRIMPRDSRESQASNCKLPKPRTSKACNRQTTSAQKIESPSGTYGFFTDDYFHVAK